MKCIICVLFLFFSIISCQKESEVKPAKVYYGEDICERCKMIISQKLFSAQYTLARGKVKKFDDIGCMMHYIREEETQKDKILAIFVRDYNSEEWIKGERAYYVWSENIKTPMGHGIIAFEDPIEAGETMKKTKGEVLQFESLSNID